MAATRLIALHVNKGKSSGVYEPPTQKGTSRCAVHPLKPQPVRRNAITEYCADMNVILLLWMKNSCFPRGDIFRLRGKRRKMM